MLVIRYGVLPIEAISNAANVNIESFIDKFITSVFTAVIVGYFLFWIIADEKKKQIEFTESRSEIEKYLSNSRKTTDSWLFNGGLGRYTKSDTIPKLSEHALKERKTIYINIIVLHPFNISLLNKYIDFRLSVESPNKRAKWTILEAQSEILATIITALYYKKHNQFLNISIKVKDFFTLSRMDISNSLAVITREDPTIPSIILEKDSFMYKHYSEEFQQVSRQSQSLDYTFSSVEAPTIQEIQKCLSSMFPQDTICADLLDNIFNKFKTPENPFASW
ncbi:hypothetical protein GCM10023189_06950 [Nibrella saemangeumensis]|uniref:Uncharacterized protein n=1 Tax=Nibrella saemangeumensis TaxID=1084526 RepID=A0ABP8MGQ6_9BACT